MRNEDADAVVVEVSKQRKTWMHAVARTWNDSILLNVNSLINQCYDIGSMCPMDFLAEVPSLSSVNCVTLLKCVETGNTSN